MTPFRSETETLRARVEELEREKAELAESISPTAPRFDTLRLFRRIAWFLIASSGVFISPTSAAPTAWGKFCAVYLGTAGVFVFLWLTHDLSWTVTATAVGAMLSLVLLRVWLRYGMNLEDTASKADWAHRFE